MQFPCCLCICAPRHPYQCLNAWTSVYETWLIYHDSWAYLSGIRVLYKSLPLVCVSVCASLLSLLGNGSLKYIQHSVAWQRLGKHVPAATKTRNNSWTRVSVDPLSFLGNNSVKTFPWQQRVVGGVVFYAVRVVSKANMSLVHPRTPCFPTIFLK
jgi:hypothetical protein